MRSLDKEGGPSVRLSLDLSLYARLQNFSLEERKETLNSRVRSVVRSLRIWSEAEKAAEGGFRIAVAQTTWNGKDKLFVLLHI